MLNIGNTILFATLNHLESEETQVMGCYANPYDLDLSKNHILTYCCKQRTNTNFISVISGIEDEQYMPFLQQQFKIMNYHLPYIRYVPLERRY